MRPVWPLLLALGFGLATWWFWSMASAIVVAQYTIDWIDFTSGLIMVAFGFMAMGTTAGFVVIWLKRRLVRRCARARYRAIAVVAYGQAAFVAMMWVATLSGWI